MQHETGVRPIEMSVGSSRGLVLGMDNVKSGDEEASDVNPEDGDETEGDKVMDSDTDGPESAEQEFSAEDAPEEIKIKRVPNPADPTPAERERHNATHVPYRPWCSICVEANGKEDPHYRQVKSELQGGLPEAAMDYASLCETKDKSDKIRLMIGKERWTKSFFCNKVKCKGLGDPHIVSNVVKFIETMGHTKIALTTDGEPAIVQVQAEIQRKRAPLMTVPRNPPAYDPQSNGLAERAVGQVKGQIRAIKLGLEARIGASLDLREPMVDWITRHAVSLLNKFHVGVDGRTAHYRIHHKNFNGKVFEIGEQVLAKPKRKTRSRSGNSTRARWLKGTWVGWDERTGEHVVVLHTGQAVRIRSVRPVPESERWSAEAVRAMRATPNVPNPKDIDQRDPLPARDAKRKDDAARGQDLPEPEVRDGEHRDFRITEKLLEKYGHTEGCPGCHHKRAGLDHRQHTAECRQRLEKAIIVEEHYKDMIKRRDERLRRSKHPEAEIPGHPAMNAGPGTPRLSEGDKEQSVGEDEEYAQLYSPTDNEEDPPPLVVEEDSESESGPASSDGSDESTDEEKKEADQWPEAKRQRLDEIKRRLKIVRSDAARVFLNTLSNPEEPDVAEVYSPPRMTKMARRLGMRAGCVIDLTEMDEDGVPYDLTKESVRQKVKRMINEQKPFMLVMGPPCTPFSSLQALNRSKRDPEVIKAELEEGVQHVKFAVELCNLQHQAGRRFVMEHPSSATSWSLNCVRALMQQKGVVKVNFDFCMFGMRARDALGEAAAKKRTGIVTNSLPVAESLETMQCQGKHRHVQLMGGKAKACEVYTDEFCKAICLAVRRDRNMSEQKKIHVMNITKMMENMPTPHEAADPWEELYKGVNFYDDITGHVMDQKRAVAARKLEMDFFKQMMVYTKVPRKEAQDGGHKVITTRWLDVNKGDAENPDYRARLVGRELNTEARLDLFAATPPLESLRIMCAIAASNQRREDPFVIQSVDVKRAYFYAKSTRAIYVEIPIEDYEDGDELRVGKLNLSLYGTRDAAQNWSKEYTAFLEGIGFVKGGASPCNFVHEARELYLSCHGDDFTTTGPKSGVEWLEKQFRGRYEIKVKTIGYAKDLEKEARILNRTIRFAEDAVEYEPDRRHADLIIREFFPQGAKPAATPGTDIGRSEKDRMCSAEMNKADARRFRGLAARINYLAMDRTDLQYSAKTVAKSMATPREADWATMKRVAKYLVGAPRCIQKFKWQDAQDLIVTHSDSDWAGKEKDRKSTSGGVITYGQHVLKTWSSQQQTIALSSGEAELYALLKAAAQTKGMMAVLADFGIKVQGTVLTDASAALGIVHREGLGKTRHIEVQYLWIQQEIAKKSFQVTKVGTHDNLADILTKNVTAECMARHLNTMKFYFDASYAAKDLRISRIGNDSWVARKDSGEWIREHVNPRTAMFTPYKIALGPKKSEEVGSVRITVGKFVDGKEFVKVEDWKSLTEAHERSEKPWTGFTMFAKMV